MYDYDELEDWGLNREADQLINQALAGGQRALDRYVERHLGRKSPDLIEALIVAQRAAWKLCGHRERFSHDCPAINGDGEDGWCPGCYVAAQIAFTSGLLGVLWRERLGTDSYS